MQPDWATAAGGVKMEMRSPWDSPQSGGPPPGAQLSHHNSPFGCPPVPPPAVQQGLGQSLSNPQLAGSGPPNAGTPSGETSSSGSSTTVAAAAAAQQGSSSNYGQVGQGFSHCGFLPIFSRKNCPLSIPVIFIILQAFKDPSIKKCFQNILHVSLNSKRYEIHFDVILERGRLYCGKSITIQPPLMEHIRQK